MADIQTILDEMRDSNTNAARNAQLKLQEEIGSLRQAAMELCWQIEKCGVSEEQTKASVLAAKLESRLNDMLP